MRILDRLNSSRSAIRSFSSGTSRGRGSRGRIGGAPRLALVAALLLVSLASAGRWRPALGVEQVDWRTALDMKEGRTAARAEAVAVELSRTETLRFAQGLRLRFTTEQGSEESVLAGSELERPLTGVVADLDRDGAAEVVTSAAVDGGGSERGRLVVYRGNPLYRAPRAVRRELERLGETISPFFERALALDTPFAAEWLAVGDFDGDGWRDVVAARSGEARLLVYRGDGRAGLHHRPAVRWLPAGLTALATGEVNRRDGLEDLVVAVSDGTEARLLIFQSPAGALLAEPESLVVDEPVRALAVGALDGVGPGDVAAATARGIRVVRGRDRRVAISKALHGFGVEGPTVETLHLPERPRSLVAADLLGDGVEELAVAGENGRLFVVAVSGNRASREANSSVVTVAGASVSHLVAGRFSGTFGLVDRSGDGAGSLRILGSEWLEAGWGKAATATRVHEIGSLRLGVPVIAALPARIDGDAMDDLVLLVEGLAGPVVLPTATAATYVVNTASDTDDGTCDVAHCSLREAVAAANASPGYDAIEVDSDVGFDSILPTANMPTITEEVLLDGTQAEGFLSWDTRYFADASCSSCFGFRVASGASGTTIAGFLMGSFDRDGIYLDGADNNLIRGNVIGLQSLGSGAAANGGDGVEIRGGSNNTIGGFSAADRNVISGNEDNGIRIIDPTDAAGTTGNRILGNYVGTGTQGGTAVGNELHGISVYRAADNTIGEPGGGNVVSGNTGSGVSLGGGATGTTIQGNEIGTTADGSAALANDHGLFIDGGSSSSTIGGTASGAGNVISGNADDGIHLQGSSNFTDILGNLIGLNAAGTGAVPNGDDGVLVASASYTTIGGFSGGARNIISGNVSAGIFLTNFETHDTEVLGNYVGTDSLGTAGVGNGSGVRLDHYTVDNVVEGNLVSGNAGDGIRLTFQSVSNDILGNRIGTDASGMADLGNGGAGVELSQSSGNTIGGSAGDANTIAFNGNGGVVVHLGAGDAITGNSIHSNTGLGIDLLESGVGGVTVNDPGDGDGGANGLQNFPLVSSAARGSGTIVITGTLDSSASAAFTVELFASRACDSSGHGEGEIALGSTQVTTDGSGSGGFSVSLPAPPADAGWITATATSGTGDTSELSACVAVVEVEIFSDGFESGNTSVWSSSAP